MITTTSSRRDTTVSREADGWSVCCSCAEVPTQPLPRTGRETGIDVGVQMLLVTAGGDRVETPRHYPRAERALQTAQQWVARRTTGSQRRHTAVQGLATRQQHVRRQRRDVHHQTALGLVCQYAVISVEARQPANWSRRPAPRADEHGAFAHNGVAQKAGLNKSIHDAGWRHVLGLLASTAAGAGTRAEAVPPASTSQECSGCGKRISKSLSVRTPVCATCGLMLDRDENAAKTIQWRCPRLWAVAGMPAAINREPVGL